MIREEMRAALWRGREGIAAGAVVAFGLWVAAQGGWVLLPFGLAVAAFGAGLGVQAWRRLRFAQGGAAPGVVEVDEGQISYMGPTLGGFVAVPDLVELRLMTLRGQRLWRLKQADGQVLLVPVEAAGAEALFDVFATLPGMDMAALLAALAPAGQGAGTGLATGEVMQVIWRRAGRGMSTV
ncbi:hypothetical protein [Tabrizicola sp. TH137]|uniref:hypothetical protein n=1 Tax=Tabrizicola sp. TH137 TaxID=2067452 RepID=UPI001C1FD305|nr:hypothetical protein [Tabrizicola sp. TH137]